MPYIENGREIGRDESRDYEYNGVTDRWYDAGPAVIRPESYPPEAIREMDRLAQEKKEEEERTRRTQQYKEQQESSRNAWIAWGRE